MKQLNGEFSCKLDTKGRILMPSNLKKQVSEAADSTFFINRGFEECLVLYPKDAWQEITKEINKLNLYVKKNREFARYFYRGATELKLDKQYRLLLPKSLLGHGGIEKEVILFAFADRIEIWDKEKYENSLNVEPEEFAELGELVMGKKTGNDDQENSSVS